MTMLKFDAHLVGMHFRPPAKDVVNLLAANTELLAQRQPENPYDVNAIQVLLYGFCEGGQHEELYRKFVAEAKAAGVEVDEEDDDAEDQMEENDAAVQEELAKLVDPLPLGFICNGDKTGGKKADLIAPQMDGVGMTSVPCKLTFDEKGKPMVVIEADFSPPTTEQAIEKATTGPDTNKV